VKGKIREQFYNFVPQPKTIEDNYPKRVEYALYVLSLKEWNLDSMLYTYLWNPLKRIGTHWKVLNFKYIFVFAGSAVVIGLILINFTQIIPKFITIIYLFCLGILDF